MTRANEILAEILAPLLEETIASREQLAENIEDLCQKLDATEPGDTRRMAIIQALGMVCYGCAPLLTKVLRTDS